MFFEKSLVKLLGGGGPELRVFVLPAFPLRIPCPADVYPLRRHAFALPKTQRYCYVVTFVNRVKVSNHFFCP